MDGYEISRQRSFSIWFVLLGAVLVLPLFISFDVAHRSVGLFPGFDVANNGQTSLITLPLSFFLSPVLVFLAVAVGRGFQPVGRWLKYLFGFALWMIGLGVYSVFVSGLSVLPYLIQWLLPVVLIVCFARLRDSLEGLLLGSYLANFFVVWLVSMHLILSCVFPGERSGDTFWGISVYQAHNYFPFVVAAVFYGLTPFFFNNTRKVAISNWWQTIFLALYGLSVMIVVWALASREALLLVGVSVLIALVYGGRIYSRQVRLFQLIALLLFLLIGFVSSFSTVPCFSNGYSFSKSREAFSDSFTYRRVSALANPNDKNYLSAKRGDILRQCFDDFSLLLGRSFGNEIKGVAVIGRGYVRFHPETTLLFGSKMQKMRNGPHNYYIDVFMWGGLPAFLLMLFAWVLLSLEAMKCFRRTVRRGDWNDDILKLHGISLIILFSFLVSNNVRVMFRQPYASMIISLLLAVFFVYFDNCRHSRVQSTKNPNFSFKECDAQMDTGSELMKN